MKPSNHFVRILHRSLRAISSICLLAGLVPLHAQKVQHPLDPLNFQEYWTVLEVLDESGHVDEDTRFSLINLVPPSKDLVWSWKKGDEFPREAYALVRQKEKTFEAAVNIRAGELSSWKELTDIQPNWLDEEHKALKKEIKKHPDFIEAMKKRGITNLAFIDCDVGPPGYYGTEEQKGRRVGHATCHDVRQRRNRWTRRIEGLTVVVDMHEKKILRVVDEGDRETLEERADRREPLLLSLRRDDRMKLVAVTPGEDPPEPADEPTDDPDGGSSDP